MEPDGARRHPVIDRGYREPRLWFVHEVEDPSDRRCQYDCNIYRPVHVTPTHSLSVSVALATSQLTQLCISVPCQNTRLPRVQCVYNPF